MRCFGVSSCPFRVEQKFWTIRVQTSPRISIERSSVPGVDGVRLASFTIRVNALQHTSIAARSFFVFYYFPFLFFSSILKKINICYPPCIASTKHCWNLNINTTAGLCFGPVLLPPVHLGAFSILENKLVSYADEFSLTSYLAVALESLNRDLGKVSELCDSWVIKLNVSKTKTMIVSRPLMMHLKSPPLTIGGNVLK